MNFLSKKGSSLEYNLMVNNFNGILQALSLNLVIPFASIYAKRLNASDNDIALLNSYPAIFSIAAVFVGTYLFRKFKNKKSITAAFFGMGRTFFLIFILIPFLPLWLQPGLFVFLYGMMNFPNSIANMGWQSYLGDLFSNTWRGRAFSKRSSISNIAALVVTLLTGCMLNFIPHNNTERIHLYQMFFFLAFVVAIFEVYSFTRHRLDKNSKQLETITEMNDKPWYLKLKEIFNIIRKDKKFIDFSICVTAFSFTWQMGWPIFFTYEFNILHSNEFWTSIESTVSFIAQAIAFILWQKFSEKKGNSYAIFAATLFMAFCPFFYMMSTKIYQVAIFTVVTGAATAGTVLLLSNNLYESAPDKNRTVYIGFYTIITNITLMFAPILGMKLKDMFNIYIALLIVGILRILSALTFLIRYKKYKNSTGSKIVRNP